MAPGVPAGAPPQASTVASLSGVAAAAARDSRQEPTAGRLAATERCSCCCSAPTPAALTSPPSLPAGATAGRAGCRWFCTTQTAAWGWPLPAAATGATFTRGRPGTHPTSAPPPGCLAEARVPGCQTFLPQALKWIKLLDCTELIAAAHSAQHYITLPGFASLCLVLS